MFVCSNCDYASDIKLGKCPYCNSFGTFVEDSTKIETKKTKHGIPVGNVLKKNIKRNEIIDRNIKLPEMERVLNGKIRKGGIYLLGGSPGIGKSTIVLQILEDLEKNNNSKYTGKRSDLMFFCNFCYFSGEEQSADIEDRRNRLFKDTKTPTIYQTNKLEDIIATVQNEKIDFFVVDSIQTIYTDGIDSPSGSIQQVKYCADRLARFGKENNVAILIIGHITKSGDIAGPKYLEHIVDVVLHIEGDRLSDTRFLRSYKNRFGTTNEVGIFTMTARGLQAVNDLTNRILSNANLEQPGTVLSIGLDNDRPVIVVVEVLLNKIWNKYPSINCVGVENKRVEMITAIAKKYIGLKLDEFDIYVNIPGEFKLYDSGLDLAILSAIYSAYKDKVLGKKFIFLGELTLGGKVTKTRLHKRRLSAIPKGFSVIDFEKLISVKDIGK